MSVSHHSPLIILRDIACIVSDSELFISFELLVLGVDLSTGVVVMTFELFIHCMEKVLDNRRKTVNLSTLTASILSLPSLFLSSSTPSFLLLHSLLSPFPSSLLSLPSLLPLLSFFLLPSLPLSLAHSISDSPHKEAGLIQ